MRVLVAATQMRAHLCLAYRPGLRKWARIVARSGGKYVLDHYTWDKHAKHLYDLFSMISGDQSNQRGPHAIGL
jgi:hypothetical protein